MTWENEEKRTVTVRIIFLQNTNPPVQIELTPDEQVVGATYNGYHTSVTVVKDAVNG